MLCFAEPSAGLYSLSFFVSAAPADILDTLTSAFSFLLLQQIFDIGYV